MSWRQPPDTLEDESVTFVQGFVLRKDLDLRERAWHDETSICRHCDHNLKAHTREGCRRKDCNCRRTGAIARGEVHPNGVRKSQP